MPKLYPEDQARVNQVLAENGNQTERQPFRLWRLMAVLVASLATVSVISMIIAWANDIF